jgi:methylmalonyl-CoA mutase cobalamin-binding domain/chain
MAERRDLADLVEVLQTGLSIAFDLPTQTGYDADHPLARGEVGRVGVPVSHLGDMMALLDGIPLDRMNTSMTINAPAAWLLALYVATAERQGVARASLQGTTQNDIVKEYLSRGTYIFPPAPSLKLTADTIAFTTRELPKWNPVNVCSYHLQEAGATPVQEMAFTLATAIAILDAVKATDQVADAEFSAVVGRISFFVNAGIKFITELCKLRAFAELWDELTLTRYGVTDPKHRIFRYGVQVNSLGLTEQQPENNVYRILLEMLAVVLSKRARARAVQLPAWNEALGLPRPWDQQWSLRLQQIVAYETDLLDYGDIFDGSKEIDAKVASLKTEAQAELDRVLAMGGAVAAVESSYMKQRLVESNARRVAAIESGEQVVVGVNKFTETAPSPLLSGGDGGFLAIDATAEAEQIASLQAWRTQRDNAKATGRARRAASRGAGRRQHHGAVDRLRPCRRDHGRVEPGAASGLRRVPRADGRRQGRRGRRRGEPDRRAPARAQRVGPARPPHQVPGRQARARRPLQRRRADRRARPGLRLRGGLRGHPPDPGADRQRGAGGRRARRRPVRAVGQPCRAGPRGARRVAQGGHRRGTADPRRHRAARGRKGADGGRRRPRLHAQGLRPDPRDGRDRDDRRGGLSSAAAE